MQPKPKRSICMLFRGKSKRNFDEIAWTINSTYLWYTEYVRFPNFDRKTVTWVARNSAYHQKNVVINCLQCEFRTVLPWHYCMPCSHSTCTNPYVPPVPGTVKIRDVMQYSHHVPQCRHTKYRGWANQHWGTVQYIRTSLVNDVLDSIDVSGI